MSTTAYFERRQEELTVDFCERRVISNRRDEQKDIGDDRRRRASKVRRIQRETVNVPVNLFVRKKEVEGVMSNISAEGLLLFCKLNLHAGTPMNLQFSFGGVCYLNLSGQAIFSIPSGPVEPIKYKTGIKFSGVRNWEKKIICSAITELRENPKEQQKSMVSVLVSEDNIAIEAQTLYKERKGLKRDSDFDFSGAPGEKIDGLTFQERRQFEIPTRFVTRREKERRGGHIPPLVERRKVLGETKTGILTSLQMDSSFASTREGIKAILGHLSDLDPTTVDETVSIRSLGLDSFNMVEMLAMIETFYNVSLDDDVIFKIGTVADLINLIHVRVSVD